MATEEVNKKMQAHKECLDLVKDKIERSAKHLNELKGASANDTKSSAGDKFQTSREMLQQEINKAQAHLSQLQSQLQVLNSLRPQETSEIIKLGSYVVTSVGDFYISTSLGKVKSGTQFFYAISAESPMAMALINNQAETEVRINDRRIFIQFVK